MRRSLVTKVMLVGLVFASLSFLLAENASAVWYQVLITRVQVNCDGTADGQVNIEFVPGTGEVGFVGTGKAWIGNNAIANNRLLAIVLTASSMGWECGINLQNVPSATPQKIITLRTDVP